MGGSIRKCPGVDQKEQIIADSIRHQLDISSHKKEGVTGWSPLLMVMKLLRLK